MPFDDKYKINFKVKHLGNILFTYLVGRASLKKIQINNLVNFVNTIFKQYVD